MISETAQIQKAAVHAYLAPLIDQGRRMAKRPKKKKIAAVRNLAIGELDKRAVGSACVGNGTSEIVSCSAG
jgi:hypothetical protein